jgi:NADPH:quinone reductase-like Zn-dependent oxidoreductase
MDAWKGEFQRFKVAKQINEYPALLFMSLSSGRPQLFQAWILPHPSTSKSQPLLQHPSKLCYSITMRALTLDALHRTATVEEVAKPSPGPTEILIKIESIALNPVDPLYVRNPLGSTGRTVGSDFAGIISSIGTSVPSTSGLHISQRVAGFLQGACSVNDRPGAFAEFAVCPWDLVWQVPDSVTLDEAAAVSLCSLTAAQAIFYRLRLKAPFPSTRRAESGIASANEGHEDTLNVFIYGASTSVGLYAAQLVHHSAKFSGRKIRLLGAASKHRFSMLKSEPYGYDELVDYRDQDWPDQICAVTSGTGIHYAYDCISEGDTVQQTSKLLHKNGRIAIVRSREGGAWTETNLPIEPIYGAVWEGLGVDIQYQGLTVPCSPQARSFAVAFYTWLSNGGRLEPNPIRRMPGSLESIVSDGFVLLGPGSMQERENIRTESWMAPVSAEKLVYRIAMNK